MKDDAYYMKLALKEAEKAQMLNEVPIGALIVIDDQIVSRGHNLAGNRAECYCPRGATCD